MKKFLLVLLAVAVLASTMILPAVAEEPAIRDFVKGTDFMSFDQILVDGTQIANGNDQVIAAKALIDSYTKLTKTVTMHGWFGSQEAAVAAYGYRIDGGDFVWTGKKIDPEQPVIDAGGDSRYTIDVDVTKLLDGETHTAEAAALLENGTIVLMNRNHDSKDRIAMFNYKAPFVKVSRDQLMLDGADIGSFGGNPYNSYARLAGGTGKTIKFWGWVASSIEDFDFGLKINYSENTIFNESYNYPDAATEAVVQEWYTFPIHLMRFSITCGPITSGWYTLQAIFSDGNNDLIIWDAEFITDGTYQPQIFGYTNNPGTGLWLGHQTNPLSTTFEINAGAAFSGIFFYADTGQAQVQTLQLSE